MVGAELGSRFLGVVVSPVDVVCFLFCVGKLTSKVHMYGTSASHTYYIHMFTCLMFNV